MTGNETVNRLFQAGETLVRNDQAVLPMYVLIRGGEEVGILTAPPHEREEKAPVVGAALAFAKALEFNELYMIADVFLSSYDSEPDLEEVPTPSEDPAATDALCVWSLNHRGEWTGAWTWEYGRNDSGEVSFRRPKPVPADEASALGGLFDSVIRYIWSTFPFPSMREIVSTLINMEFGIALDPEVAKEVEKHMD